MRMIIAIIQPAKLKAVQEALRRIGVTRLTVGDAMGFARQRGQDETYRGSEYKTNLLRKIALEIAVNEDFLETHGGVPRTGVAHRRRRQHRRRKNLRPANGPGHSDQRRTSRAGSHLILDRDVKLVLLSTDLMIIAAVQGIADRRGVALRVVAKAADAAAAIDEGVQTLIAADLSTPGLEIAALVASLSAAQAASAHVMAFGPHVHVASLAAATAAGCDEVVSRGEFQRRLDAALAGLSS